MTNNCSTEGMCNVARNPYAREDYADVSPNAQAVSVKMNAVDAARIRELEAKAVEGWYPSDNSIEELVDSVDAWMDYTLGYVHDGGNVYYR